MPSLVTAPWPSRSRQLICIHGRPPSGSTAACEIGRAWRSAPAIGDRTSRQPVCILVTTRVPHFWDRKLCVCRNLVGHSHLFILQNTKINLHNVSNSPVSRCIFSSCVALEQFLRDLDQFLKTSQNWLKTKEVPGWEPGRCRWPHTVSHR